jgi:DNA transformation protein and related proteins
MAVDDGLMDWLSECMAPVGNMTMRKMMGGGTFYLDGTIFAIIANDALWFKSDAEGDAEWDAAGCARFTYDFGNGMSGSMNYRRAPDEVYDDPDELRRWAAIGLSAGQRAAAKKKPRLPKKKAPAKEA